jgi:hypothetical protein
LFFTKGDARRVASLSALEAARGSVDLAKIFGILRSHGSYDPRRNRRNMESLCVHSGGLLNTATTASMVVEYLSPQGTQAILWFTGTSYPCLSIYKPVVLRDGSFIPLWTEYDYREEGSSALAHWGRQRAWIRKARAGAAALDPAFVERRERIQARIVATASAVSAGGEVEAARRAVNESVREWYDGLRGF